MCTTTKTIYSCSHDATDTFPCNPCLDGPSRQCDTQQALPAISAPHPCPNCTASASAARDEEAELAAALKRIATDPTLAAHSTQHEALGRAKTREYFEKCGHYAKQTLRGYDRERGEPEWFDLPMPGSCYGCCAASDLQVQELKLLDKWKDPWGELTRCWDEVEEPPTDVDERGKVKGEDKVARAASGSSAAGPSNAPSMPPDYDYDEDSQDDRYRYRSEAIDTSPMKNKGPAWSAAVHGRD